MAAIGSDTEGVTDISLAALKKIHATGAKLTRVDITPEDGCTCRFHFGSDVYSATGFGVGYSGSGPHGLWKAILMWYPHKLPEFYETPIPSFDDGKRYTWTPEMGFEEAT